MRPFPSESQMRWRRLDVPGREEARVERAAAGWRLTGQVEVEEDGVPARLDYRIDCDPEWRTRFAWIEGEAGGRTFRFALTADGAGEWARDGQALPELAGALDVDLGFTPATNTLPIRRLGLAVGETAPVRSAWLRFPELRLEPLEQTYTREAEQVYRYKAQVDGDLFTARLDTDEYGRVSCYEGLWVVERALKAEGVEPADERSRMKKDVFPILYARDLPRLISFYRNLIGMTESFRFPQEGDPAYVTLAWGGGSLGLGTYEVTPGLEARDLRLPKEGRGFELCLYVPDVDAVVTRLQAEGFETLVAPVDQPWGERLAYVQDPEGNTIMLTAAIRPEGETEEPPSEKT